MKIRSFAKINLGIEVLEKREDNYHNIRTLFQAIDLFDILEFRPTAEKTIRLRGNVRTIPWDDRNLVFRAADLLKKLYQKDGGVEIKVVKNIPA